MKVHAVKKRPAKKRESFGSILRNNWQLYILILPAVIYFIVFNYLPLYGIQIAFKDYKAVSGIAGSAWVGLKHFKTFFNAYYFKRLLSNTLLLNVYSLLWSFPIPLILAIFLNQIKNPKRKRFIQTSIYVYGSIGRNALYLPFPNERNIQYSTRSIGDEGCGFYV